MLHLILLAREQNLQIPQKQSLDKDLNDIKLEGLHAFLYKYKFGPRERVTFRKEIQPLCADLDCRYTVFLSSSVFNSQELYLHFLTEATYSF